MSSSSKSQITPLLSITWKPIWVKPRTKAVLEQLKRKKKKNGEPMKLNAKYPLLVLALFATG